MIKSIRKSTLCTEIDLPLTLINQNIPLRLSEWHSLNSHAGPLAVKAARPKRRVLGLSEPNWPHIWAAVRVNVPEIE